MIFPNSNLPNDAQPWGREVQKRVESIEATVKSNDVNNTARDRQLAASVARIDKTVTELAITQGVVSGATNDLTAVNNEIASLNTQINNNLVNGSMTLVYAGADGAKTDTAVARVTFTKPTWASKVTVNCTGNVDAFTTDHAGNPISGTMTVQIDGVKAQTATSISDPTLTGTTVNKSISTTASNVHTQAVQSFSRSFTTSGSVTVELIVTKTANTLTTATYIANLVASAYWSE